MHASALKHGVVMLGITEVFKNRSWIETQMGKSEKKTRRAKAGFTIGQQTPRMCGLFPATKAISFWKDFRDEECYLISGLGGMWAPGQGAVASGH